MKNKKKKKKAWQWGWEGQGMAGMTEEKQARRQTETEETDNMLLPVSTFPPTCLPSLSLSAIPSPSISNPLSTLSSSLGGDRTGWDGWMKSMGRQDMDWTGTKTP